MSDSPEVPRSAPRLAEIAPEDAGMRIDNYLLRVLRGVPRSRVYRLLRRGEVRVNKGRARPTYRLRAGDKVRIPPVRTGPPAAATGAAGVPAALRRQLEAAVLFEDARLLVIDKPAGLAVHGGSGVSLGAIEALRALRPKGSLELVHRLDRDTSGCLMVAKRRSELRALHALLREGRVDKRYLVLLTGALREEKVICDAPLSIGRRGGERHAFVDEQGKPAVTEFRRLQLFSNATFVEAILHTGRTHQIRAHAAHLGYAVAGDDRYGDGAVNATAGLRRLFLHAHALRFTRPHNGEDFHVDAPLPAALRAVLDALN